MLTRLRRFLTDVADAFWLLPAVIVLALSGLAILTVELQAVGHLSDWAPVGWIYGGGDTGARTLLGAIASSTIGVAGTLFSITIAALTLASNQMGPRLLRNFMRDRGNQAVLGVLLGTFAYSILVLRSVRGGDETAFVPGLGVTVGLLLAAVCIGLLIYFIHHVANRINVDTVIDLVHEDVLRDMRRLTTDEAPAALDTSGAWTAAARVCLKQSGYLQQLDARSLADWAASNEVCIRLLKRPGEFVFAHAPIAEMSAKVEGAEEAVGARLALSRQAGSPEDFTFPIAQLVEVAVRALSPGINDPRTAISVLNRLGAVLSDLSRRHLRSGVWPVEGVTRVMVPALTYGEVVGSMFDMIRQNAGGSPSVLFHLLAVIKAVAALELDPDRTAVLLHHARVTVEEGRAHFVSAADRERLEDIYSDCVHGFASSGRSQSMATS